MAFRQGVSRTDLASCLQALGRRLHNKSYQLAPIMDLFQTELAPRMDLIWTMGIVGAYLRECVSVRGSRAVVHLAHGLRGTLITKHVSGEVRLPSQRTPFTADSFYRG